MKCMGAVGSDSVKSAMKAKDKLHNVKEHQKLVSELCMGWNETECACQAWESHETVIDFLVNTHVQSHALLRRGFGTSVPFIIQGAVSLHNSVGQTKIIHCYKVSSLEFHRDNHASSVNINTAVFSKHNCVQTLFCTNWWCCNVSFNLSTCFLTVATLELPFIPEHILWPRLQWETQWETFGGNSCFFVYFMVEKPITTDVFDMNGLVVFLINKWLRSLWCTYSWHKMAHDESVVVSLIPI